MSFTIPKSTFPVVCTVHSELRASHTKDDAHTHANACVELAQQPALLLMTSAIITPTARLTCPSVLPPTTAPFARYLSAPRRHVHALLPALPRVLLKPFLCDATVHLLYPACRLSGAAAALAGRVTISLGMLLYVTLCQCSYAPTCMERAIGGAAQGAVIGGIWGEKLWRSSANVSC